MPEDRQALADARIGELRHLQVFLAGPSLSLYEIHAYVSERLEALCPLDYHVYRRRWEQLAAGTMLGDANWLCFDHGGAKLAAGGNSEHTGCCRLASNIKFHHAREKVFYIFWNIVRFFTTLTCRTNWSNLGSLTLAQAYIPAHNVLVSTT